MPDSPTSAAPAKLAEYRRLVHNGLPHYGQHLIATALGCNESILSIETMSEFLKTMADEIDMVRFGEPIVARFGGGIETGISGVQLIETSAIVIHTNDAHRDLYLDVFSCKAFEQSTVERVLDEYLSPTTTTSEVFYRR
ncbi:S-adenosylmethionine decarboxylase proenzyme [Pseudobythopirellula maris]|uniref:S-adenosylmethionine decarboxylase proenzyme n=1 Tax=Pseudobythopirellula maris TaxID=2527991 RepID=A0A5C5ZUF9_9BACT|nr:S-adenosylmethionine decarboxylase [Pseudobythopirellula maris]TWT89813.1 S-adenosylmethionine decarboxylase proenzyme [Pseudobythopirellula maris]